MLVDRSGQLRTISSGWESLEGLAWAPSGKEIWFSAAVIRGAVVHPCRHIVGQAKDGVLRHGADAHP